MKMESVTNPVGETNDASLAVIFYKWRLRGKDQGLQKPYLEVVTYSRRFDKSIINRRTVERGWGYHRTDERAYGQTLFQRWNDASKKERNYPLDYSSSLVGNLVCEKRKDSKGQQYPRPSYNRFHTQGWESDGRSVWILQRMEGSRLAEERYGNVYLAEKRYENVYRFGSWKGVDQPSGYGNVWNCVPVWKLEGCRLAEWVWKGMEMYADYWSG